LFTT